MTGGTAETPPYNPVLQQLRGDVSTDSLSCSILKVPNHLRQISEKAYEPQVISIGPYHHAKVQLEAMEGHKMSNLKMLRTRIGESSLERCETALKDMEQEARKFYSKPLKGFDNCAEKFVDMMLLDGCFIIELILNNYHLQDFLLRRVKRDLLLVENQLPFRILSELFNMTGMSNGPARDFTDMAIKFFSGVMPGSQIGRIKSGQDMEHLLGLLHDSRSPPRPRRVGPSPPTSTSYAPESFVCSGPQQEVRAAQWRPTERDSNPEKWRFISSAIQLSEAGINFKKIEGGLFDIKFENGVMSIPTLRIDDATESILRSLVAYEQCFKGASSNCFTDYLTFMDYLINTGKDVELLCHRGVIDNCLGDHEVVATIFNKLRDSVLISGDDFSYAEIFNEVNKHCNRKWNLWKANLWHNYFNTPWAGISFLAAVFLLLLTVLQSVYAVLSYHHK